MVSSNAGHVLVTGGAGYLGSALIPHLLAGGDWVTVIDQLMYGAEGCLAHTYHPRFGLLAMDIGDSEIKQAVIQSINETGAPPIQVVVHLAAAVGHQVCQVLGEQGTHRVNVTGAEKIFRLAHELGARRFIFASTCSVYGRTQSQVIDENGPLRPVSLYGRSKVEAEQSLQQMTPGLSSQLLIFRLASVFGLSPRMRFDVLVNQLVRQAASENKVVLFHPNHWRPFIHIKDVADAFKVAIDAEEIAHDPLIVNLGSEKTCLTKTALAEALKKLAPEVEIETSNQTLSPPDQDVRLDFSRLETELGFQPERSLRQGMQEVLSALRQGWFAYPPDHYQNRHSTSQ
jgi:nucleoside-diphosphate-sugar epimerase